MFNSMYSIQKILTFFTVEVSLFVYVCVYVCVSHRLCPPH